MSILTMTRASSLERTITANKAKRIESIDLLRGVVMIIMALDHVRSYFHQAAFVYEPNDLTQTSAAIFFTRFITHYCAPIFVFLAGISAYLYGTKRSKKELAVYLFTRGLWLVFVELFIIVLGRSFNPSYPYLNLQVIWAIGISMIVLSAMIYMKRQFILAIAVVLIAGHNFLDTVHVPGTGVTSLVWAVLHEKQSFVFGHLTVYIQYPVLPWVGVIALGYYFGSIYASNYDPEKRKKTLLFLGFAAIGLFLLLRSFNIYGDAAEWSVQKNSVFSLLSFLNVTKYPPSLLYVLVTLGPAMIFLALVEKPLNAFTAKIAVFGRAPFFYYVAHIYLIHLLAVFGAIFSGYQWSDMAILSDKVNSVQELKRSYGFNLGTTYLVWIGIILLLYPCCKWFDKYKRTYQSTKPWLTYL